MSVRAMAWAWGVKCGDPGTKLVLMKLADNADENGYSRWGQKRLGDECEMSRPTVQRKLVKLVKMGLLVTEERRRGDGGRTANGYRLIPPASNRGGVARSDEAAPAHSGEAAMNRQENRHKASTTTARPAEVDGVPVTDHERRLALDVLEETNRQAGTRFTSQEWIRMIVMRIRAHPDLDVAEFASVVERSLARPWWRDDFSPSVIFGNDRVFERALNARRGEREEELSGYSTV